VRESRQETSNLQQCRGSVKGGRGYFNFFNKQKGLQYRELGGYTVKEQGSFVYHSVKKWRIIIQMKQRIKKEKT
jgi:hypothetical protein